MTISTHSEASHASSPEAVALVPADEPLASTHRAHRAVSAMRLLAMVLIVWLFSCTFVVVPAGTRGVMLRFGAIQNAELGEGLHLLLPLIDTLETMDVRLHSQVLHSEAACSDLQDVGFELAVNWHLPSDHVVDVFRQIGDETAISKTLIVPALEDSLKEVVAGYSAEQLISSRVSVKQELEGLVRRRFMPYQLVLDSIDLLQLDFSERFRQAVEAKQVAVQDARRAEFLVLKAKRLAEARIHEAEGEAKAQELLQQGLTAEVLQHQALEKWNGRLPLVMDSSAIHSFDLARLQKLEQKRSS